MQELVSAYVYDVSHRAIVSWLWFKVHTDSSLLGESGLQRKTHLSINLNVVVVLTENLALSNEIEISWSI